MIHYFNPGHEMAVLNASKYYQPTVNQVKMQQELAYLPAWYADAGDFVWLENHLPETFLQKNPFGNDLAQAITVNDIHSFKNELNQQRIAFWGLSPQSIHLFEKINQQFQLNLQIPQWQAMWHELGSRFAAQKVLSQLIRQFPQLEKNLLPQCFSKIEDIETILIQSAEKQLIKSPYSSSGRGLVWLPAGKLATSQRQIIGGMLKKQSQVSMEKVLDKQLDFSMHFDIHSGKVRFIGYSVFQTNAKGAYEKSLLASQEKIKQLIIHYIDEQELIQIQQALVLEIQKIYAPHYAGNVGVDMLVYQSKNQYRLHPCVEINMRKSMGYLAIQIQNNYVHPESKGYFYIDYRKAASETYQRHLSLQKQFPLVTENHRIRSGYLNLCPVMTNSNYHACIIIE
ncbi:MAG: hypothetical protein LBV57_01860 [Candidatus Symbiothrix sp.]|jgi:hypothetical protein|nr:hypothetical protein [Candidatus Symbiothrix sp.]